MSNLFSLDESVNKDLILKASSNGLYFYYLTIGCHLPLAKDGLSTMSICNPFTGTGNNFKFYFRNKDCQWYFTDSQNSKYRKGDLFDFAIEYYYLKYNIKSEKEVFNLMHHDLFLNTFSHADIEDLIQDQRDPQPITNGKIVSFVFDRIPIVPLDKILWKAKKSLFKIKSIQEDENSEEASQVISFSTTEMQNEVSTSLCDKINRQNECFNEVQTYSIRTAVQRLEEAKDFDEILPFMDVFFQKEELVFFFGETGKGKSILAIQIADAITKGISIMGLENKMGPVPVVFYDFELTDKQFHKRYFSEETNEQYAFNEKLFIDNLEVTELNSENVSFEEVVINHFKKTVIETNAEVLIIDNITFLSNDDAQEGQVAQKLMKRLKQLKNELHISILVLAHTTKRQSNCITVNDMAGSKKLSNFADGVFAIGESKTDQDTRYLKQVKPSRSGELKYGANNVLQCIINKNGAFLGFDFIGCCDESELHNAPSSEDQNEIKEVIFNLYVSGKTCREIAEKVNVSKSTVNRWINEMLKTGIVPTKS
jgi:KaiC/GvpD/RAD55 family RecA-like ATPase